jgi:GT2 family glycosyltransferase
MELSVIIVSYNAREYLKECLFTVRKASANINCEVFVVDNNSVDGSAIMVKDDFPEIKLIRNNVNSGFSAANNLAIKLSAGDYVLLLNPDTTIPEDTFSKCISFMKEHPEAGALGVKMVNGDGRFLPESKRAFPTPLTGFFKTFGLSAVFPRSKFFNRYYSTHISPDETGSTEVISGAFMFLRMAALKKAGLPDEDFFMYGEDIDLSYRIISSGYKNFYFGEVTITHYKGKSTKRDNYTDLIHFYDAMRIYSHKRNTERFDPLHFIVIPATYFRQGLALLNRFIRITFLQ